MADFNSYIETQTKIETNYMNKDEWAVKAVLNTARTGWFSSDRTIREYARDIWKIERQL